MLYVPTNKAKALNIELSLGTPRAAGKLRLGSRWVEVEPEADRIDLVIPSAEASRGLSRLELLWQGAEPLVIKGIRLKEEST